jgi:hypothetical protein
MIDCLARVQSAMSDLRPVEMQLRNRLASKCDGDAVTRRIVGRRRAAKITAPDESFDQTLLKGLWNSHPDLARQYMKIGVLDVQVREFRKLVNSTSDQADFTYFRDAMTRAHRGRIGTPRVEIEK